MTMSLANTTSSSPSPIQKKKKKIAYDRRTISQMQERKEEVKDHKLMCLGIFAKPDLATKSKYSHKQP